MATAKSQLTDWFTFLTQFRKCCASIDSDAASLSGPGFANAKPSLYLPDPDDQNQFAICAGNATALPVAAASVCSAASFRVILENSFGFLNVYVAAYLQSLSPAPFKTMNRDDYILQKNNAVFPGGSADPHWVAIDQGLAAIMGDCCSSTQRPKVTAIVSDPTKIVTDIVNQIAVLG